MSIKIDVKINWKISFEKNGYHNFMIFYILSILNLRVPKKNQEFMNDNRRWIWIINKCVRAPQNVV